MSVSAQTTVSVLRDRWEAKWKKHLMNPEMGHAYWLVHLGMLLWRCVCTSVSVSRLRTCINKMSANSPFSVFRLLIQGLALES